MVMKSLFAYKN